MPVGGRTLKHLPAIDGLRAIAVLAVVAYHAGLPVPAGFVGVDVFFVISGYLITRLLADELRDTGRIDFLHFYARRARRILPAALLVIAVTVVLSWLLLRSGRGDIAESAAAAGLFVANVFFQSATGDYWSASAETMPLLHLWSLSVEEQFYLLWPVLLIAVRRRPLPWLLAVAGVSFVLAETLLWLNPQAAFYQMPARAWELAAGGIVALGAFRVPRWGGLLGLAAVLAACLFPAPHFPGIGALPAVAGAALLIAGVHAGQRVALLEFRPVVWVGLISYSLYLWHWPLLALDRATRAGEAPLSTRLILCGVAVLLAAMSYRYVETPLRRGRGRPAHTVAVGVACLLALAGTAHALAETVPSKPRPAITATDRQCHPYGPGVKPMAQAPQCVEDAPKIVLWGDSHAFAWEGFAEALAEPKGLAVAVFWESECYALVGEPAPMSGGPRAEASCKAHNDGAVAYLRQHRADTLVIASRWLRLFREHPELGREGLLDLARAAAPHVDRILVIGPVPEMRDDVERCRAQRLDCAMPRSEFDAQAKSALTVMAELDALPKVEVVDPSGFLCDESTCHAERDGQPLYWDRHHVMRPVAEAFGRQYR